jgi:hypothetical protein
MRIGDFYTPLPDALYEYLSGTPHRSWKHIIADRPGIDYRQLFVFLSRTWIQVRSDRLQAVPGGTETADQAPQSMARQSMRLTI